MPDSALLSVLSSAGVAGVFCILFITGLIFLASSFLQSSVRSLNKLRAFSIAEARALVHGISNLYVADASLFPSIGAVNPALTVMALAMRQASHLLER